MIVVETGKRRDAVWARLKNADKPLTGAVLARRFGVSRQVIVQDIALLRAGGAEILATPRGYLIVSRTTGDDFQAVAACRHNFAQIEDEIGIVVDCGGRVVDVMVDHPVYGELRGSLMIANRRDLKLFIKQLKNSKANPLLTLTGGIHLHTLQAPDRVVMDEILASLDRAGFLVR